MYLWQLKYPPNPMNTHVCSMIRIRVGISSFVVTNDVTIDQ